MTKGFFDAKARQAAQQAGAFLLMPLLHSLTLWTTEGSQAPEQSLDLAGALALSSENRVEWPEVFLGTKGKHRAGPVRLIAFRLSPERRTPARRLARIDADPGANAQRQSPPTGRLALAGHQRPGRQTALRFAGLSLSGALADRIDFPAGQVGAASGQNRK